MTQFEMITRIKAAGITHPADIKGILAEMIEMQQERSQLNK